MNLLRRSSDWRTLVLWVLCSQKPSENSLSPRLTHRRWTCSLYFAVINPQKLQALELFHTRVELIIFPQDDPTNILIKPFFFIYWHPLWVRHPPILWLGIQQWTKLTKSSPVGLTSRLSMGGRDKQTNKWKYKMSECKVQRGEYSQ